MRVLYVPMYTARTPNGCSSFKWAYQFFSWAMDHMPRMFLYFPVEAAWVEELSERQLFKNPRVKMIPFDQLEDNQARCMEKFDEYLGSMFDAIDGEYFVDTLICDRPGAIPQFQVRLTGPYKLLPLVTVATAQFVLDKTHFVVSQPLMDRHVFGFEQSDLILWLDHVQKQRLLKEAAQLLAPNRLVKFQENGIDYGMLAVDLDLLKSFPVKKDPEIKRICFAYAMSSGYNPEVTADMLIKVFQSGRKVEAHFNTSSGSASVLLNRIQDRYGDLIHSTHNLPLLDWYGELAKAHAFLVWVDYGELLFTVMEQQMLGQVGVFRDRAIMREQLYPGYPYLFENMEEGTAMLLYVLDQYESDEVQAVIRRQKEFLLEKFSIQDAFARAWSKIAEVTEKKQAAVPARGKIELLKELRIESYGDRLTMFQVAELVKKKSKQGVDVFKRNFRTMYDKQIWRLAMLRLGYIDEELDEHPVFVKP